MQCVILAGGLGTRMRPQTETVPKILLPVAGRPFVHHQLDLLATVGIDDVVFCLGYLGNLVEAEVGLRDDQDLSISYVYDGSKLLGTGGALRVAHDQGVLDDEFFVLYGDSYLPVDFAAVWRSYLNSPCTALMTVYENADAHDTSNVVYSAGKVHLYDKELANRPVGMRYIDYGLSILACSVISEFTSPGSVADLAEIFRLLSICGGLAGYEVKERFYEIGSSAGLDELGRLLESR